MPSFWEGALLGLAVAALLAGVGGYLSDRFVVRNRTRVVLAVAYFSGFLGISFVTHPPSFDHPLLSGVQFALLGLGVGQVYDLFDFRPNGKQARALEPRV